MSEWETKAAIQAVLNGYSGAVARRDIDAFLGHFAEDAEVHGVPELLGQAGPLRGRAAIGGFFGPLLAGLAWVQQQNTTTDIVLSPDGATATTSTGLVERAKPHDREAMLLIARYDDALKRDGGRWIFTRRTLVPYSFTTGAT